MKRALSVNPIIPILLLNNSHSSSGTHLSIITLSYFQFYVLLALSALFSFAIIRLFWHGMDWFGRIILTIVVIFFVTLFTFIFGFMSIDIFNSIKLP